MVITREFDLPVELLFKAYIEPEFVEQWMGTKVLKLESKKHGSYQVETSDPRGNVAFRANGVIHEFIPNKKITDFAPASIYRRYIRILGREFREFALHNRGARLHPEWVKSASSEVGGDVCVDEIISELMIAHLEGKASAAG